MGMGAPLFLLKTYLSNAPFSLPLTGDRRLLETMTNACILPEDITARARDPAIFLGSLTFGFTFASWVVKINTLPCYI